MAWQVVVPMGEVGEITEEERERLREFSESDDRHPDKLANGTVYDMVDADTCAEMRRAVKEADVRTRAAEEFEEKQDTVFYHALGKCSHEVDEEPARRIRTPGNIGTNTNNGGDDGE